jgi:hypothetical protein
MEQSNFVCPLCFTETIRYGKKDMCKPCYMHEFNKKNYEKNKEAIKKASSTYYYLNHEENKLRRRMAQKMNPYYKMYQKTYHKEHREEALKKMNEYYNENTEKILKKQYENKKERLKTDIDYRLKETLSSRMRMAIMHHRGLKESSAIELLGADIKIVREYLEKQFKDGMSWKNHGTSGWHIDHIIPCDKFDLTIPEEQKKCFHYTNLQPLWFIDNLKKSNLIEKNIVEQKKFDEF